MENLDKSETIKTTINDLLWKRNIVKEGAPYRILNFHKVHVLVRQNLFKCEACGTAEQFLDEKLTIGAASNITIERKTCIAEETKCVEKVQ